MANEPTHTHETASNQITTSKTISKTTLNGKHITLEPLAPQHVPGLTTLIDEGGLWKIPYTNIPHPDDVSAFIKAAETAHQQQRELAFATLENNTGTIVGSTRFRNIDVANRRLEIGFTFIGPRWQRSPINTEAKYLMLCHAFEHWQMNRVELLTDVRNWQSRKAISRIGARQEGVLRQHMVMRDGHIRDSVIFSITSGEWPTCKQQLLEKMTGDH